MTDELKNYISAINAPPSKPQSSKKKTEKDCNEPAGISATSICCTRSSRTARSCTARLRHQAFQSEIQSSKERLDKIKSYNDIDSFARDIGSQTQTKPTEVLNNLTSVIASS